MVSTPAHSYGAALSVQTAVQAPPVGRNSSVTPVTPVPEPSAAFIESVTVPRSGPAGGTTETVGAVLSSVRVSVASVWLPAASVARARSS